MLVRPSFQHVPFIPNPRNPMRNLQYYFGNPFHDDGINQNDLIRFASDHLDRLNTKNDSRDWDTQIASLSAALTAIKNDSAATPATSARRTVEHVLFQSLLDLVKAFPDQPAVLGDFMRPELLGAPSISPTAANERSDYDSSSSSSSGYSDSSSSSSSTSSSSSGPLMSSSSSSSYSSSSSSSSSYDSSSSSSSSSLT